LQKGLIVSNWCNTGKNFTGTFKKIKQLHNFVASNRGLHKQIPNNKYIYIILINKFENINNNGILKAKWKASSSEDATLY